MVIGSYFLFKCSWQNKSWQLYAGLPVLFLRWWFCEIWKSWLKRSQGIGGDYSSSILYIVKLGLGVHSTVLLPYRDCILILITHCWISLMLSSFTLRLSRSSSDCFQFIQVTSDYLGLYFSTRVPRGNRWTGGGAAWGCCCKSLLCWLVNKINNWPLI